MVKVLAAWVKMNPKRVSMSECLEAIYIYISSNRRRYRVCIVKTLEFYEAGFWGSNGSRLQFRGTD